jgi:hypothetical protein
MVLYWFFYSLLNQMSSDSPGDPYQKEHKLVDKCIEKQPDIVQSRPLMRDRPGNNRWVSAGSEQALQTAHISIYYATSIYYLEIQSLFLKLRLYH